MGGDSILHNEYGISTIYKNRGQKINKMLVIVMIISKDMQLDFLIYSSKNSFPAKKWRNKNDNRP